MLDTTHPIELTHSAVIMSKDGRKWKAGIYEANTVPPELAIEHCGKNLDPNAKHEYAKPSVLGEENEPELKLEAKVYVSGDPTREDKSVATKAVATTPAPAPVPAPPAA